MNDRFLINRARATLAIIFVVMLAWLVSGLISHAGKTKVVLRVIPSDSAISIDGRPGHQGSLYLKPGSHTFVAKKSGFSDDSKTINLGKSSQNVNLLPAPSSAEALQWLRNNPDIQRQREALGSENVTQAGQVAIQQTPLISILPVTSLQGPFSINYGPSTTRKNATVIVITDSSPHGRAKALQWIRQHGYDPTDLEISYQDFINPLVGGGGVE